MTVVLIDACDSLAYIPVGGPDAPGSPKWDSSYLNIINSDDRGGRCIRLSTGSTNWYQQGMYKTYPAATEIMCSAYMRMSTVVTGATLWNWYIGGGSGFAIGRLYISSNQYGDSKARFTEHTNTNVRAVGSYVWVPNVWVHVETYLKIAAVGGRFVMKIKPVGGSYTTDIDFTGDTSYGGATPTSQALNWMGDRGDAANGSDLDDVVIRTAESNFLGVTRVRTLRPSAAGLYSQLTSVPAVTNCKVESDVPDDGDTTYVTGGAGSKDLYEFGNLKPLDIPLLAQMVMVGRKDDGAARSIAALIKTGSEVQGSTQAVAAAYAAYVERYATDPADASAWTKAKIDAAQIGVVAVA